VADRKNSRIQVFDQDGNFIAAWKQFGQPSSVFVSKDDTILCRRGVRGSCGEEGATAGDCGGNAKDGR